MDRDPYKKCFFCGQTLGDSSSVWSIYHSQRARIAVLMLGGISLFTIGLFVFDSQSSPLHCVSINFFIVLVLIITNLMWRKHSLANLVSDSSGLDEVDTENSKKCGFCGQELKEGSFASTKFGNHRKRVAAIMFVVFPLMFAWCLVGTIPSLSYLSPYIHSLAMFILVVACIKWR